MNIFTSDPSTADMIARQTIAERIHRAEERAQVRAARAARRAARQASRPRQAAPPENHDLPWWASRFVRPAH